MKTNNKGWSELVLDRNLSAVFAPEYWITGVLDRERRFLSIPIWLLYVASSLLLLTAPCTAAQSPHLRSFTKSSSANKRIEILAGHFALWVDEAKWKDKVDAVGVLNFSTVTSEGMGVRVIAADAKVSTDRLLETVLYNVRSFSPDAKIRFREKRIVNGRQVIALKTTGTMKGLPVTFFGYYYGGSSGNLQAMGFIIGSATRDNIEELTDFLNGLEISEEDVPSTSTGIVSPGLLRLNSVVSVKYDPEKWEWEETDDPTDFHFYSSSDNDTEAEVLAERVSVPADALLKFALSNVHDAYPNARIISKRKCHVNSAKVWFLRVAVVKDKEPWVILGYFYAGKAGVVQLFTVTKESLLPDCEKDLMEFLNGLVISE